jgi:hypothetical protein
MTLSARKNRAKPVTPGRLMTILCKPLPFLRLRHMLSDPRGMPVLHRSCRHVAFRQHAPARILPAKPVSSKTASPYAMLPFRNTPVPVGNMLWLLL